VGRDLDVVVVCEINVDIVVAGVEWPPVIGAERWVDIISLTAGSSGILTATNLADLGLRVGVCGLVGDDMFGRFMLDHLDRHHIDRSGVVVDPLEHTGAGVLLSAAHDRAILTYSGSMAHFGLDAVRFDVLARARHLHMSSYFLQSGLAFDAPDMLKRAHEFGLTTSVDTGHDPAETWSIGDLLDHADLFLPNEVEACAFAGTDDPHQALERLAGRVPLLVVKRGPDGALAARGSERAEVPGFVVEVRDTTGAGDAFDAGFLSGWLDDAPLEECMQRGCACGALTVAHIGGTGAVSPERVEALLQASTTGVTS
jgi:sugar/nucleoside kinase (ribokinase family)